jgi:hypothetical protein
MNYFAHGFPFIDDPYFLAGTAVPDWLSVCDRQSRVRQRHAAQFVGDANPVCAAVARGIVQHHEDDAWFHTTEVFHELQWKLTAACRDALPADEGFRPSFVGHILVELLLDAALVDVEPARLDRYYAAMGSIDREAIEHAVNCMAPISAERLAKFVHMFCEVRFLEDYADDRRLLYRLNQVMQRVRLTPLPDEFLEVIGPARELIASRAGDLLGERTVGLARAG